MLAPESEQWFNVKLSGGNMNYTVYAVRNYNGTLHSLHSFADDARRATGWGRTDATVWMLVPGKQWKQISAYDMEEP